MTLDYTLFAPEIAYTDREDPLTLQTKTHYLSGQNASAMYLIDADGKTYPLQQDSVVLKADSYTGIAAGEWDIDFTGTAG